MLRRRLPLPQQQHGAVFVPRPPASHKTINSHSISAAAPFTAYFHRGTHIRSVYHHHQQQQQQQHVCRATSGNNDASATDGADGGGQQPPGNNKKLVGGHDGGGSDDSSSDGGPAGNTQQGPQRRWPLWYNVWIWATALTYLVWRYKWRRDRRLAAEQLAREQEQEEELRQEWYSFAQSYGIKQPPKQQ